MIIKTEIRYFDYRQLCLYICGIENPFNHWSKEEYDQGFAYRPQSVSFRTIWEANDYEVIVEENNDKIDDDAIIIIEVPFEIDSDKSICISSVSDSTGDEMQFPLQKGNYSLRYEAFPPAGSEEFEAVQKIRIVFNANKNADFCVLRNDGTLKVSSKYHISGRPA